MIECPDCNVEIMECDFATNRKGDVEMVLYKCGNEECQGYGDNFHWYDVEKDTLHEGAWHL